MANFKRARFRADGPFVMRRTNPIAGVSFELGQVVTREDLAAVGDRKLEAMFEAHWLDMAPADAVVEPSAGGEGLGAPQSPVEPAVEPDAGNGGAAPDAPSSAAPEADTGAQGAAGVGGAPADTNSAKVAAYKSFGFGRYHAINAAGEKIGAAVSRSAAEGLAARDRVPLLGQGENLGG